MNTTIIGIGITPEGLSDAYAPAELMFEMSWRDEPVTDMNGWITDYARRRYGVYDENASEGWKILLPNVLNSTCKFPNRKVLIAHVPKLDLKDYLWYNVSDIATSWDRFISAADDLKMEDGYR